MLFTTLMFHSWLITIQCKDCKTEYKLRTPVMPSWPHGHCSRAEMKKMLFRPCNEECELCHPELAPTPVIRWRGRKSALPVWSVKKLDDGSLEIQLAPKRTKKKAA